MSTTQSTEGLDALEKIAVTYENKKNTINTIILVVVLAVGGFFAYKYLVVAPNEEKAGIAIMAAEQFYAMDSISRALNGDGQNAGFLKIIKKYDGTASANIAHYYAGSCYLKMGDYKSAIKHLGEFNAHGSLFEKAKSGLLGDAYMETNNVKKAIEQYKDATNDPDDNIYTPLYLQHLAVAYEKSNQTEEAKKAYIRIRDEFPRSFQSREVEKSLAQLGVLE
ncbi:MAG: tetratricopeptide repeat protein [Phycisphaerales bacterium]|nr:tetratricopeptide repeat protein [Phycisphaerales bacterium]